VRLAEAVYKRLREKNPSKSVKLKFDRLYKTEGTKNSTAVKNNQPLSVGAPSQRAKLTKNSLLDRSCSSSLVVVFAATGLGIIPLSVKAVELRQTQSIAQAQPSNINILYVSSSGGSDSGGNGSDRSPFKTLTYALSVAPPNTAILLAPGTYSAQSGENFPLMLKPNVTVQGNPGTRGQNIVIKGGGYFISPTWAGQNIAILGADGAGLSGVTVTNPHDRGYGLWIESSSPTVVNNTFSGSTHDGISVVGTGRPTISGNLFSKNGANGITIFNKSEPFVRENVFENTGFGVNVAQQASPMLVGNQITRNKDGVVVQAEAKPVLRNNYIERNERDGIVAISQSLPDLGTAAAPGGNVIRNNGRHDVNNAAKGQVIQAYGNQLAIGRTAGRVDVAGTFSPAPSMGGSASQLSADRPPSSSDPVNVLPVYTPGRLSPITPSVPSAPPPPITRLPGNQRTGNSELRALTPPRSANPESAVGSIAIPVPTPEFRSSVSEISDRPNFTPNFDSSSPVISEGVLPVPSSRIPLGRGGYVPAGLGGNSVSDSEDNSPSFDRSIALSYPYQVIVDSSSGEDLAKLRSLVPDAFRTFIGGRSVMQVGAFKTREEAEELIQRLAVNDLNARIEERK
jgi:parallel beta-helix repeat protein